MQKRLKLLPQKSKNESAPSKQLVIAVSFVVLLAVIVAGLIFFAWFSRTPNAYIQGDKYQAIFLTNNQAYFGKLQKLNDGSYRMTDVYYIKQASTDTTAQAQQPAASTNKSGDSVTSTPQQQSQLVKLGSEVHGPSDEIVFAPQNILFWENLKSDGTVVKSITEAKKSNQ